MEKISITLSSAEKSFKGEFDTFNDMVKTQLKIFINSNYPAMPDYRQINRMRMEMVKKLAIKHQVNIDRCLEIIGWSDFLKEEVEAEKYKKEADDLNKKGMWYFNLGMSAEEITERAKIIEEDGKERLIRIMEHPRNAF